MTYLTRTFCRPAVYELSQCFKKKKTFGKYVNVSIYVFGVREKLFQLSNYRVILMIFFSIDLCGGFFCFFFVFNYPICFAKFSDWKYLNNNKKKRVLVKRIIFLSHDINNMTYKRDRERERETCPVFARKIYPVVYNTRVMFAILLQPLRVPSDFQWLT